VRNVPRAPTVFKSALWPTTRLKKLNAILVLKELYVMVEAMYMDYQDIGVILKVTVLLSAFYVLMAIAKRNQITTGMTFANLIEKEYYVHVRISF
jgi:hypothetical protein